MNRMQPSFNFRMPVLMLAVLACTTISFARLGETLPELEQRFGKAKAPHPAQITTQGKRVRIGDTVLFRDGDWVMTAILISNKCESLTYGKISDFTPEQMQKLLQSNAQNSGWVQDVKQSNSAQRVWLRFDGTTAKFEKRSKTMQFTAPAYHAQVKKVEEEEKRKAAKVPEF